MSLAERCRRFRLPARRQVVHLGTCLAAWCAYLLAFVPLYRMTGPGATSLITVPVLLAAWQFGTLAGTVAGVLAMPVTLSLLALAGHPDVFGEALLGCACPLAALLLTAVAVGRLRTLTDRLADQVIEQRRIEAALERRAGVQQQLLESARQLTESIQLSETLARIAGHARDILASQGCAIYRLSPDGATLHPLVVIEPTRDRTITDKPLRVDHSYSGRSVHAGHPLIFNDVVTNPSGGWTPLDLPERQERVIAAPLSVDGRILGAIALNRIGDPYDAEDLAVCEAFAAYAAIALRNASLYEDLKREAEERRLAESALERSERMFRSVVQQSVDGIALVDQAGRVVIWNGAEERITGVPRSEAIGSRLADIQFSLALEHQRTPEARAQIEEMQGAFLSTGTAPWLGRPVEREFQSRDGTPHVVQSIVFPIVTDGHRMYGSINRDVTEQRRAERVIEASLREKEVLLREIHHRVKNNLQIIASLLELQGDNIRDPEALTQLAEGQQRIRSMALIHESLYRSADLASVNLAEYVADLAEQLSASYGLDPDRVRVVVEVADVRLGIDTAIPCGLLINELVSNSLKHAFPSRRAGRVRVTLRQAEGRVELGVSDDGVGLPLGLDYRATATLGLQLVNLLTAQLHGEIHLAPGRGASFRIAFPLPEPQNDGVAAAGVSS
jgi:two-component system, sensor histidine kinase PdtaS